VIFHSSKNIKPVLSLDSSGNLGIGSTYPQGTLTLHKKDAQESLSVDDLRLFKDMCGLLEYVTKVDPKFAEYVIAYEASKKVVK
jgi:hypothetical protein